MLTKFIKYWNTIRYSRYIQIIGRLKLLFFSPKVKISKSFKKSQRKGVWVKPAKFSQKMEGKNTFIFLNESHNLNNKWNNQNLSKLWLYNLHYFDDLNSIKSKERNEWHVKLINSWIEKNPIGFGNGWEPYPTSLRIVNWIKWSLSGSKMLDSWDSSLKVQAAYLSQKIEIHLLGNHLFANAKALIFAGLYFNDNEAKKWYKKGINIIENELSEQVLNDGGNFELSTMYHKIFLIDLLDLVNIHNAFNLRSPEILIKTINPMIRWLEIMSHPDGEISFFNDAAFGITPSVLEISNYSQKLGFNEFDFDNFSDDSLLILKDSGYSRVQKKDLVAIIDRASIGPSYLPAHAHADTLSFELSLFDKRVIVNSGTSVYESSIERLNQRGTAAHSTVVIDGKDSSEVWSSFRVARRAEIINSKSMEHEGKIILSAGHNGYHRLKGKPAHFRTWEFDNQTLSIKDEVIGKGEHHIKAIFPLHPDIILDVHSENEVTINVAGKKVQIEFYGNGFLDIEKSTFHPEFGISIENFQIHYYLREKLPITIETRISW